MNGTRKKLFAFGAVAVMLVAGFAVLLAEEEENEVEAISIDWKPGINIGVFGLMMLAAMFGGDDNNDTFSRSEEANILAASLASGASYYSNSLSMYASLWPLTEEHWKRQAELAATSMWTADAEYDYDAIMEASGLYENIGQMLDNMSSQVNAHWQQIGTRVQEWNSVSAYSNGQLSLSINYGNRSQSVAAGGSFDMRIGTILRDVSPLANQAWFSGGDIYASKACTITNGQSFYNLNQGWNTLPATTEFDSGVWTFEDGVTYCGNIVTMPTSYSAQGATGIVLTVDGTTTYLTVNMETIDATSGNLAPTCTFSDGTESFSDLILRIVPTESENSETVDLMDVMARYALVFLTMQSTIPEVNTAASTVWEMFNASGEANAFLTTLMVPETYQNVTLTTEQTYMITTLAMQQLYMWWEQYGTDVAKDTYTITMDSTTLFCRGDVRLAETVDSSGNVYYTEYKDVIFTPLFYRDCTVTTGENSYNHYGFVVIWGDGQPLSTFNVADADACDIKFMPAGATMTVANIMYGGQLVDRVDLNATEVGDVDPVPVPIPDPTPIDPSNDLDEIIRLVMILLGFAILLTGFRTWNWIIIVVGVAMILIGFIFADEIETLLERVFGWYVEL